MFVGKSKFLDALVKSQGMSNLVASQDTDSLEFDNGNSGNDGVLESVLSALATPVKEIKMAPGDDANLEIMPVKLNTLDIPRLDLDHLVGPDSIDVVKDRAPSFTLLNSYVRDEDFARALFAVVHGRSASVEEISAIVASLETGGRSRLEVLYHEQINRQQSGETPIPFRDIPRTARLFRLTRAGRFSGIARRAINILHLLTANRRMRLIDRSKRIAMKQLAESVMQQNQVLEKLAQDLARTARVARRRSRPDVPVIDRDAAHLPPGLRFELPMAKLQNESYSNGSAQTLLENAGQSKEEISHLQEIISQQRAELNAMRSRFSKTERDFRRMTRAQRRSFVNLQADDDLFADLFSRAESGLEKQSYFRETLVSSMAGEKTAGGKPVKEIVQLGAGSGTFARICEAHSIEFLGVEENPELCAAARAEGVSVETGNVLDWLRAQSPQSTQAVAYLLPAAVIMSGTRLLSIVSEVHRVLSAQGLFVIETVDMGNPAAALPWLADLPHSEPVSIGAVRLMTEHFGFDEVSMSRSRRLGAGLKTRVKKAAPPDVEDMSPDIYALAFRRRS